MITRVYLVQQEAEFVRRLCATLEAAGVPPTEARLYRDKGSLAWGYYGELSTVQAVIKKGGRPPEVHGLVPLTWVHGGRPTTDFFPFSLVTGVWFETLFRWVRSNAVVLGLVIAGLLALLIRISTSVGYLTFFLLGFGSFLLESLVLFNSFLLLGDPNLSAAVAVGVFLLWSGLGSLLSERLERSPWFFAVVPAAVLVYSATAPLLNVQTIGLPLGARTLVFALHLCVGGIVVGAMFPIALRRFRHERVTSMFFIDVIGCALAPVAFWVAMSLVGVWLVGAGAVASYAVVGAVLALRR